MMSAGLLENPLMQMFMAQVAGELLGNFLPSSNSPYQRSINQQLQYGQRMMPELYNQAMGKPSAATKQAQRNLSNEANKLQQSYSASMTRANPTATATTTPVREQQARFGEAKIKGYADILSQGQTSAQNALMDMYEGAMRGQMGIEMQNRQDRSSLMSSMSGLVGEYRKMKQNTEAEAIYKPLLQRLMMLLGGDAQQNIMPTQNQTGYWTPSYDPNIT